MRFESLSLERYGAFAGTELAFRQGALVHVVHGRNEAGKTSALAAICDLLFGFGHLTPYDFEHATNALRVGARLRLADGSALLLRRRKGRGNTLVDSEDRPLAADPLAPLLGAVDRQTFLMEFGLTAEALRAGGKELMKAGGRLAETLAASSARLSALSRLRGEIEAEADGIFGPRRAAGKEFYQAADRYDAAERELRSAIVTVDAWKAANLEAQAAREAHARLQDDYAALSADLARRERARRTRPKLVALRALRAELERFHDLPAVPAPVVEGWRKALAEHARLAEQIAELEAMEAADRVRLGALAVDEALLAAAPAIGALRERLGAVAKAREDLPRRVEARRAAQELLAEAARRLGLGSYDALLQNLPTDAAIARVRELMGEGRRHAERLREAEARLEEAEAERQRLVAQDQAIEPGDPAPLLRRLDTFADIPVDAERLRRDRAGLERSRARLAEDARALEPSITALDALASLPLPGAEAIAQAASESEAMAAELRQLAADRAAAEEQITQSERALARLAGTGVVSTRADLAAIRGRRDAAFEALRAALEMQAEARLARFEALCAASAEIDAVTDRLLSDTERAAKRQALEDKHADALQQQEHIQRKGDRLRGDAARAAERWRILWRGSGVEPLAPARMARWRDRVAQLLQMRRTLQDEAIAATALAGKLDGLRPALGELARDLGLAATAEAPIEILHREVSSAVAGLQSAWTQARERVVAKQAAGRHVQTAERALAKARAESAAWHEAWPAAVAALGLPSGAGVAEAAAALEIWQGVPVHKTTFEREIRSIDGIERDLADFARDVGQIAGEFVPDRADRPPAENVAALLKRLEDNQQARQERQHLIAAGKQRELKRIPLINRLAQIAAALAEARAKLAVADDADLSGALERLGERESLRARFAATSGDLASEGLDEAALWAEQADLDPALLDASIEDLKRRIATLVAQEIGAARTRLDQAASLVATLADGRDAEGAAHAKAEAAAELVEQGERWLVRAAAGKLAALAIERHRSTVQDPLVARASVLFAGVTGGAFAGLGMDYDEKDQPILVARRADGRKVALAGLSEGTADQLFLVLRLALLERRRLEPLPFVGDDLLASFDEPRTAQALETLAAFGKSRQVILFTHHAHVADLARDRLGEGADVVRM